MDIENTSRNDSKSIQLILIQNENLHLQLKKLHFLQQTFISQTPAHPIFEFAMSRIYEKSRHDEILVHMFAQQW